MAQLDATEITFRNLALSGCFKINEFVPQYNFNLLKKIKIDFMNDKVFVQSDNSISNSILSFTMQDIYMHNYKKIHLEIRFLFSFQTHQILKQRVLFLIIEIETQITIESIALKKLIIFNILRY